MLSSKITHEGPTKSLINYWIGRLLMAIFGWEVKGKIPPGSKFVLIAAPHTSNWDFPFALSALYIFRLKVSWMGKDSLFKKPFGGIMKWLGGIPIKRDSKQGIVAETVNWFKNSDKLVIVIPPSGTRKRREYMKSGFYWIAYGAKVPFLLAYLDYAKKEAGIGLSFVPTGNVAEDMNIIREFYKDKKGKYPELETELKLLDEKN